MLAHGSYVEFKRREYQVFKILPHEDNNNFRPFFLASAYSHDAGVAGRRLSSSMMMTREGRLSDQLQKTRFLSFFVAPGVKLGTTMPVTPLVINVLASSHDGGVLP